MAAFKTALNKTPGQIKVHSMVFKLVWLIAMLILSSSLAVSIYTHAFGFLFPISGPDQYHEFLLLGLSSIAILFNPVFWRRHIRMNDYLLYQSTSICIRVLSGLVLNRSKGLDPKITLAVHTATLFSTLKLAHLSFSSLFIPELDSKSSKRNSIIHEDCEAVDDVLAHLFDTHVDCDGDNESAEFRTYNIIRNVFRVVGVLSTTCGVYASLLLYIEKDNWPTWLIASILLSGVRLIWLRQSKSANEARSERLEMVCCVYIVVLFGELFWRVFEEEKFELWRVIAGDLEMFVNARVALVVGSSVASGLSVM
jgi:hypothetical protein